MPRTAALSHKESRPLDKAVFFPESGIELTADPAYVRSDLQRTLVDALWSPRLFGSTDAAPADDAEIDPYWRVRFNVPHDRIEGWLLYGK
jgi:hypothetical protein